MGANNKPLTDAEFKKRVKAAHPHITVHSLYTKAHANVNAECNACGHKWQPKAYSLAQGHGCMICKGGGKMWTHKQYTKKLRETHGGRVKAVGEYVDSGTPMQHKCDKGHKWNARPRDVIRGKTCCRKCLQVRSVSERYSNQTRREFSERARSLTRAVYLRYSHLINPLGLKHGRTAYVVDHMYSIADCFRNPHELKDSIRLDELCHPANLQMLFFEENLTKNDKSSITASGLRSAIREWNKTYGRPFSVRGGRLSFDAKNLLQGSFDLN